MRKMLAFLWAILIFIGTCSEGVRSVIFEGNIGFSLNTSPSWSDLLLVNHSPTRTYIVQKIGHFLAFFIFSILIRKGEKQKEGLLLGVGYGIFTELLQPFFFRDARVIDMGIDAMGVFVGFWCSKFKFKFRQSKFFSRR